MIAVLKKIPLHPILFAVYPVLYLLAANISQINPLVALRPILLALLAAILLTALLWLALKDWERAALAATLVLLGFFSYGHVLGLLKSVNVAGVIIGRHRILALPFFVLLMLAVWRLLRAAPSTRRSLSAALNMAGLALVVISLVQAGSFLLRSTVPGHQPVVTTGQAQVSDQSLPDVYIIILDGYARADVLQQDFGFDNRAFIDQLKGMGFFVADKSTSNYNSTEESLTSMLNLDYLPEVIHKAQSGAELSSLLKENWVRHKLESIGYQTVAFETGYSFTDWWGVDSFLTPENGMPLASQNIRPFEAMLLKTTAVSILLDGQKNSTATDLSSANFPYADHVNQVRFTLAKLPYLALDSQPKLVFAHIICPHKPLVFKKDGSTQTDTGFFGNDSDPVDREYFKRGYLDQVEFLNAQVPAIVQSILLSSKTPPVIVMMGDHGYYWGQTHYENFLSVYAPGKGGLDFYDTISNVNVFRLIFNRYFSGTYDRLPDQRYQADAKAPDSFRLVP